MRIAIHASGFGLTDYTQGHLQPRIGFALNRLRGSIRCVSFRFSDINDRRGGIDKRCQIRVQVTKTSAMVVADVQRYLYVAITRALDRASAASVRQLGRLRRSQASIAPALLPEGATLRLRQPLVEYFT